MRLLRLELENFRSHSQLDLALDSVECAAIVGSNGAGKSSLLIALDYVLTSGGGSVDDLLSRSADRGGVTLTLEQAGKRWRINRGRERSKKSWLVVEEEKDDKFTPLAQRTMAESQEIIDTRILGMDGDAWRASVYAPQGEVGMLAAMAPGKRKELLGGLLGLDEYETWREKASLESRGARSEAESARERLGDLEARLGEAKLRFEDTESVENTRKLMAEELADQEKELSAAIKREGAVEKVRRRQQLVAQMQSVKDRAKQVKERAERRKSVTEAMAEAQAAAADLPKQQAEKDAAREAELGVQAAGEAVKSALMQVVRCENAVGEAKTAFEAANAKLKEAEEPGARCPTCNQEVAGEHREKAIAEVRGRLETATVAWGKAREELKEQQTAVDAAKDSVPPPGPQYDEAAYKRASEASASLQRLEGELLGLKDDETIEDLQGQWKQLKGEAEELPKEVPAGPSPAEVRERITTCRERLQRLEETLRNDAAARKEAAELESQRGDLQKRASEADVDERAYAVVAKAFSRDGIPAMVLDNAVGGIEAATNETLEQLGVEMSVRLVTQRQTKSGGLSETLDILVDDGTMERELSTFSGGERARIHISLRLGLAAVLSSGSGLEIGFLALDEIPDVDSAGIELLADLLTRLPQQILVVSHNAEIVDSLPQRIVVERAAGAASAVSVR